ncbi:MAG: hypothetical protein AAGF98_02295 [Cyanobacteria bacterium P01_H01_bin.153]
MNIDNLPVNDRTVQGLADQLEQIQRGLSVLTTADAWGETAAFGRRHQNRCLLTHYPRWYIQAVFAGEPLRSPTEIERFNAVMRGIDKAADDDSSELFDEVLQRELKLIRLAAVSFTQWSYAANFLGQDPAWRDAMYKRHRDRASVN